MTRLWDTDSRGKVSFDGTQGELFALQEMVTARIGNSIGREMVVVAARDSEARKSDPRATDLMLRARAVGFRRESKANYTERQALYRQVLLLEPSNVRAIVNLANSLAAEAYNRWIEDPAVRERQFSEARELALRAKELDPNEEGIYFTLATYAAAHDDFDGARRADENVLALNPKSPHAYSNLATDFLSAGNPARAIELLTQAIRLAPRNPDANVLLNMGFAHFVRGDDDAAIEWLLKSIDSNPRVLNARAFLAMAYARRGDRARSRAAVAALLQADPKFNLARFSQPGVEAHPSAFLKWWKVNLLPVWHLAGLPR